MCVYISRNANYSRHHRGYCSNYCTKFNHKTSKTYFYTGFMKAQNTLNNAVRMSIAENGPISSWSYDCSNAGAINTTFNKYIVKYLNVQAKCQGADSLGTCFGKEYYNLKNNLDSTTNYINNHLEYYDRYVLTDGMSIRTQLCLSAWVDINGPKGPNKYGRDLFLFSLNNNKALYYPPGISAKNRNKLLYLCNGGDATLPGMYCGGLLILDGGMHY